MLYLFSGRFSLEQSNITFTLIRGKITYIVNGIRHCRTQNICLLAACNLLTTFQNHFKTVYGTVWNTIFANHKGQHGGTNVQVSFCCNFS